MGGSPGVPEHLVTGSEELRSCVIAGRALVLKDEADMTAAARIDYILKKSSEVLSNGAKQGDPDVANSNRLSIFRPVELWKDMLQS